MEWYIIEIDNGRRYNAVYANEAPPYLDKRVFVQESAYFDTRKEAERFIARRRREKGRFSGLFKED